MEAIMSAELPPQAALLDDLAASADLKGKVTQAWREFAGALAVGNGSLPEGYRLDRHQIAALVALGWSPPGVVPGSGDEFGLIGSTTEAAHAAVTVTRTLRDVYGAPHPAFVTYVARDTHAAPVEIPA